MIKRNEIRNDNNYDKIVLLTKEKLENENTINLLQKNIKNLNISIIELKQENEIYKAKLRNKDILIEKMKINEIQNESELNNLKKINMNLSEQIENINLKNKEIINELNKKDLLLEKLNLNKEERENKLIKSQILISNAVKDYELYIQLNNKYEKEIKKLKANIKHYKDKNIKLENTTKELNKKILEYEKNIIQLKSDLLKSKKDLVFISSDNHELLLNNEKLKNDLININIENRNNIFLKNNLEEENAIIKQQRMQDENDIDILRANNEILLNDKNYLNRDLKMFKRENMNRAEVITQLKDKIDELNYRNNELLQRSNDNNNNNTYEIKSNNS